MALLALLALVAMEFPDDHYWRAALPVMAALAAGTVLLAFLLHGGNRRRLMGLGVPHTVVSMLVMPALYIPVMSAGSVALLLAVFAFPVAAMYLYNGSHWHA
jgi:hypothetical protein